MLKRAARPADEADRSRAKRQEDALRYCTTLTTQLLWLPLKVAAMPWPMLDIGQPLFRM